MQKLALAALLLSLVVWRNGRVAKNSIFIKSDLPVGYYVGGDFNTQCTTIAPDDAFKYCEDASFWDLVDGAGKLKERRVLISCDAGRKNWNTVMGPLNDPEPHGSLWMYSPKSGSNAKPQRLTLKGYPIGHDFHPLALEAYPSHDGSSSNLYIVNHARARTVIEHLVISPSEPNVATYVRTLSSPYFISPNALALTSPDSFYVSNDHLFTRRLPFVGHVLPLIETFLGLPFGFVSHITLAPPSTTDSPVTHKFAAILTPFANGISISPNGSEFAISATSVNQVRVYARDPATNTLLAQTDVIETPFSPDNIMYDDEGVLIIAGHPDVTALTAVAKSSGNPDAVAPSWVAAARRRDDASATLAKVFDNVAPVSASSKIPPATGHTFESIFQSNGTGFSTSCTGLHDSNSGVLYVTGLYAEKGVMICRPSKD